MFVLNSVVQLGGVTVWAPRLTKAGPEGPGQKTFTRYEYSYRPKDYASLSQRFDLRRFFQSPSPSAVYTCRIAPSLPVVFLRVSSPAFAASATIIILTSGATLLSASFYLLPPLLRSSTPRSVFRFNSNNKIGPCCAHGFPGSSSCLSAAAGRPLMPSPHLTFSLATLLSRLPSSSPCWWRVSLTLRGNPVARFHPPHPHPPLSGATLSLVLVGISVCPIPATDSPPSLPFPPSSSLCW